MIKNTSRFITLEMHDGDILNGDGHFAEMTIETLVTKLSDGEDDGDTTQVFELIWDEHGEVTVEIVTEKVAAQLKRNAECLDHPDGVPPDEREWIHPLAFKAGFEWTPTEYEIADMKADHDRDSD